MSRFDKWWSSDDCPARQLPETTQTQIKWYLREAFAAGLAAAKKKEPEG